MEIPPLSDSERKELLLNEALAEGLGGEEAEGDAGRRLRVLNRTPELLTVATTPLTVRLMRPHLDHTAGQKSLGDLLYDIIQERLGGWSSREGKEDALLEFRASFPDSLSREGLLGRIAEALYTSRTKSITVEALYTTIKHALKNGSKKSVIASQASEFFRKNVLVEEGGAYVFPSQPIFEFAFGFSVLESLTNRTMTQLYGEARHLWRQVSFAAAIARRKNTLDQVRGEFQAYIDSIQSDNLAHPAVALIISESRDVDLARSFVGSLSRARFRPLKHSLERGGSLDAAYAQCLHLSGDEGFGWFYSHYLNPAYPLDI